jgi:hypothetical protein
VGLVNLHWTLEAKVGEQFVCTAFLHSCGCHEALEEGSLNVKMLGFKETVTTCFCAMLFPHPPTCRPS